MAADWIKIEKTTAAKPEVLQLADILGIHPAHAFGLCIKFWFWCDDQMKTCHTKIVTNVTLDYVIGHTGFTNALVQVGWLRVRDGSLEVPNFDRHLSESAKKRGDSLMRKRKQRLNGVEDVTEMSQDFVTNVPPRLSLSLKIENEPDLDYESAFERFWKEYPCKQSKKPARAAFMKAIARLKKKMSAQESVDKLILAASEYADFIANAVNPPSVKYGQGWLNDERYEEDFVEALAIHNERQSSKSFAQQRDQNTRTAIEEFANG